jgi:23S rRNA pseudouridine1911/1915/1917 synthase
MEDYRILHEDADIIVADKLSAIPVQPEKTQDPSLQDLIRAELAARPGASGTFFLEAAHRIDRRCSGAVIFAKTHRALETLEADFRNKHIEKTYVACVEHGPEPREGRFEHRLVWDKRTNVVRAFRIKEGEEGKGDRGILEYRLACASERYFFLEVSLITGKHHQIRAQLAAEGMPIRGDIKYGARRTNKNGLIMLHARRLLFTQPRTRETLDLVAPFPATEPLWAAFDGVGGPA